MKIDGLGVILAIILLPIILVVTYYIQLQVDTIARENAYNTKLLDATYDAMSAFEINTANEELSSVADSMRSIILASNNTFFNTLATNLGMSNASKENLRPYVPAILYTMYDGYYIYSPAETAVVGEKTEEKDGLITTKGYLSVGGIGVKSEGNKKYSYDSSATTITYEPYDESDPTSVYGAILYKDKYNEGKYTTDKNNAVTETDYILKPYTQYSARYVKGNIDVTINYTLDNYINIEGTIDGVYYTKSGYLIDKNLVISYNDNQNFKSYSADDLKNEILGVESIAEGKTIHAKKNVSLNVNDIVIEAKWENISSDDSIETISEAEEMQKKGQLSNEQIYEIQKYKAIAYYASSAVFSNWVYTNLGDLTYGDIQDSFDKMGGNSLALASDDDFYYNFHNDSVKDKLIFKKNSTDNEDPEATESNFNTHRIEVIKNSIKYNLNQSISAYAKKKGDKNKYSLPVLTDTEWDNILSKISIVSFMQGLDCGLDVYNNYEIAYSSNNELTVIPSEIYYVPVDFFNDGGTDYRRN